MLVKKIDSSWVPSENPELKVGETIDMTNPEELIRAGSVVALDENGIEISAYELYGVIIDRELREFIEYQKMKKQEAMKESLEKELEDLKQQEAKESTKTATEEKTGGESKTATEASEKDIDSMSWQEMTKLGTELGIYKVGMKKDDLIAKLKNEA